MSNVTVEFLYRDSWDSKGDSVGEIVLPIESVIQIVAFYRAYNAYGAGVSYDTTYARGWELNGAPREIKAILGQVSLVKVKVYIPTEPRWRRKSGYSESGESAIASESFYQKALSVSPFPGLVSCWEVNPQEPNRVGRHTKVWISKHHPWVKDGRIEKSYNEYECAWYWRLR